VVNCIYTCTGGYLIVIIWWRRQKINIVRWSNSTI